VSELVRLAQRGDPAAFEQLYRLHAGRVYALCLRLAGDATVARALTQDVFVRVWERLASFREESAFSSWLHRLAVNVVLADRRAASRRGHWEVDEAQAGAGDRPDPTTWTPEQLDLETAIAALPPGARAVFVLYEIAELTGIAVGTSKAQLHRARRLLREALQR